MNVALNTRKINNTDLAARLVKPDIRRLMALQNLTYLPFSSSDNPPIYFMYRGVEEREHKEIFRAHNIRYDITVIPPKVVMGEYIKTVGHFHPVKANTGLSYSEYYEVLDGQALYLLQKNDQEGEAEEVILIEAKKGDKVYIPPNYGHITINPGKRTLVMANLVEAAFKSDYEPIKRKKGAAVYCFRDDFSGYAIVPNNNYTRQVEPKRVKAAEWPSPIPVSKKNSFYDLFVDNPRAFVFLK